MNNTFDPAQFLDMESTEPLVRRPPLPPGDYRAVVGEVTATTWQGKVDPTKSGIKYVVPLTIDVPAELQSAIGQPTIKLTDGIMLDMTESGTLDYAPGKNGGLRRYREALDMNKPGEVFSARRMQGQALLIKLTHEIYNGDIQERISGVAKIG